jgi:hypothetical protein
MSNAGIGRERLSFRYQSEENGSYTKSSIPFAR